MELQDLKIYIVDINKEITTCLLKEFKDIKNVKIKNQDILDFYYFYEDKIDCLVSPGNAFGIMSGGYDGYLSLILGKKNTDKVREYIDNHYYGEQVVGSSFIVKLDNNKSLIHTPSMRYPSIIKDDDVIYNCMRSTLMCALNNNIKCIVIPVFGGLCGGVSPSICAKRMKEAYDQILNKTKNKYNF